MELAIAELTEDELDSVFGGFGYHAHCMKSVSPNDGYGCLQPCCKPY